MIKCMFCEHNNTCALYDDVDLNCTEYHKVAMTPKEFAEEMKKIQNEFHNDRERRHREMDYLMCDLLKSLGYGDGIKIFDKTGKWYA